MAKKTDPSEEFDVDEAMERLDEINSTLAEGKMSLKDSVELYNEGVLLAEKAKEHLEGVEQKLQIVNADEE